MEPSTGGETNAGTEQTQGTPQESQGEDDAEGRDGLLTTPNWNDRKLLPGGANVPIDNLNNPTTLTVLGIVISVLGIILQLTMMRV